MFHKLFPPQLVLLITFRILCIFLELQIAVTHEIFPESRTCDLGKRGYLHLDVIQHILVLDALISIVDASLPFGTPWTHTEHIYKFVQCTKMILDIFFGV